MEYHEYVQGICDYSLKVLDNDCLHFLPMRRNNDRVNTRRGFVIGRTNLKTGSITIDIFTPKKRAFKKISSILSVLCHEVAHHQKKPYRQRYRGKIITRIHYPIFYRQVKRNLNKLRKDKILSKFFV